jgi:MoxR-like ATPase
MNLNWKRILDVGLRLIPGNEVQLKLCLIALTLNKNVLIEDLPGMGKTTLVKFFAQSTGLQFKRIQFTSDLLPSDIIGSSIFQRSSEEFIFRKGPIFSELILADELNRGSPKTQSALLEAMEEKMVTVEDQSYSLSDFFSVFATQNPRGQFGTFPLPESQLDRFLFKFSMGRLNAQEEVELLRTGPRRKSLDELSVLISKEELKSIKMMIQDIHISDEIYHYLQDLIQETRASGDLNGLSMRGGLDLLEAAKAWATFRERNYLSVQDIQDVFPYVAGHRLYSNQNFPAQEEFLKAKELISKVKFFKT